MTSRSTTYVSIAGVLLLAFGTVSCQKWEIHGDQQRQNGQNVQKLGASVAGQRDKLAVDGLRAGDYEKGKINYERHLLTDGTRSLTGHAGMSADNMGNRGKNFGLGYQDPKTSVNWDRAFTGPVRTDTYTAERNFFKSPDGRGTIGGYVQHSRNNFGMRDTQGGLRAGWAFRR